MYIWATLTLAGVLTWLSFPKSPIHPAQWQVFAVVVILATVAQFLEAEFGNQSYYPHTVFFFLGVIVLPPFLFVLLILIPHLLEWIHKRLTNSKYLRDWYIQPFNIAIHVIAGISAQVTYFTLGTLMPSPALPHLIVSGILAALVYLLVNHALIGQVLVLARGVSWQESQVFDLENLYSDFTMLIMGYVLAELWKLNPWLLIPGLTPLILVYRALMVPQLKKEVQTDPKTGLTNAAYFKKQFLEEFKRAERFDRPLALIMADLDLLRDINNRYGHLAGDVVLKGVSDLIRKHVRNFDIAARFGGEGFAIVLPETELAVAHAVAERLRRALETTVFHAPSSDVPIRATISLGVACYPDDATGPDDLIHQADIALYQAKYQGRNRVVLAAQVPHSLRLAFDASQKAARWALSSKQATQPAPPTEAKDIQASAPVPAGSDLSVPEQPEPGSIPSPAVHPSTNGRATPATPPVPAASRAAAPPPDPQEEAQQPRPSGQKLLWPFIALVIGSALAAAVWGWDLYPAQSLSAVALLAALAVLAEVLQVNVYDDNTVSISVSTLCAAAIIGGIPGVVAVSAAIALTHYLKVRPTWYKTSFNWAIHVLSHLPVVLLFAHIPFSLDVRTIPLILLFGLPVIMLMFLIETGLVTTAIALSSGSRFSTVWRDQFQWLAIHYAVLGIIGLLLAVAYSFMGLAGMVVFILPGFVLRYTQKLYVDRTKASVTELRRMNAELLQANREVARANQEIQDLNSDLMLTLAKIIDARDPFVSSHAIQVADLATAIGQKVGLPPERLEQLRQAALLHDIGKLAIPEKILHKPGNLTPEEREIIKTHATIGADFLETSRGLRHLAPFVRHHHERWDGAGYPNGLKGEEIPLEARILALCDAVDAMASDRPYRAALPVSEILKEVRKHAGGQFDPQVVEGFLQVVAESHGQIVVNSAVQITQNEERARRLLGQWKEPAPVSSKATVLPKMPGLSRATG